MMLAHPTPNVFFVTTGNEVPQAKRAATQSGAEPGRRTCFAVNQVSPARSPRLLGASRAFRNNEGMNPVGTSGAGVENLGEFGLDLVFVETPRDRQLFDEQRLRSVEHLALAEREIL